MKFLPPWWSGYFWWGGKHFKAQISPKSHKESSWSATTQLHSLAIRKDFYFNTVFIGVRPVELVVLSCMFRVDRFIKHLQDHNAGKLIWLFGKAGGIATSRKELHLELLFKEQHFKPSLIYTHAANRKASYLNWMLTRKLLAFSEVWDVASINLPCLKILHHGMLFLPNQHVHNHLQRIGSNKFRTKGPISKTLVWAGCLDLIHH